MSDRPTDHRARQIWHPRSANRPEPELDRRPHEAAPPEPDAQGSHPAHRSADVRVLAPTQDPDTAALSAGLVAIAERALADELQAEQLVAGICRQQIALVTTATRSAMPSQRDAARAELERLVRRAALDALPPIIGAAPTDQGRRGRATGPTVSRKVGKPAAGATGRRATPAPTSPATTAPPSPAPPIAAARPRPPAPEPAPAELKRRPAGQPTGLADPQHADLPPAEPQSAEPQSAEPPRGDEPGADGQSADRPRGPATAPRGTATALEARPGHRGRQAALAALALVVVLGGLGFGYFAYAPEAPLGPERTATPAPTPTATVAEAPAPDEISPESLQLEAVEPAAGPLHQRAEIAEPPSPPSPPEQSAAPPAPQPAVALGADLRLILLHQNNGAAAARADDLRATLASLKDPLQIELRSVDFGIATPRIRYFYADDATAAAALADHLAPPANGTGSWEIQDFTHFRPGPTEGTIEVFIPTTTDN